MRSQMEIAGEWRVPNEGEDFVSATIEPIWYLSVDSVTLIWYYLNRLQKCEPGKNEVDSGSSPE